MEHIYAVKSQDELARYQEFAASIQKRLNDYIAFLEKEYQVRDLPRSILWTNPDIATRLISSIPLPAYTNEFRIVMSPDLETWRAIYLHQLDSLKKSEAYEKLYHYYTKEFSLNHVMQILGHELAHHSALFGDDDGYYDRVWFEEGMVEYISRRYFLTEDEYQAEFHVNQMLVESLKETYGGHPLSEFGAKTYEEDYASILFEYWRSFLAVHQIIQNHDGDVKAVFETYHRWMAEGNGQSLSEWFGLPL